MKKAPMSHPWLSVLDEYDFSPGVRGKYAKRYMQGSNVIVLDPDVAKIFSDATSVNQALRALAEIIQQQSKNSSSRVGS